MRRILSQLCAVVLLFGLSEQAYADLADDLPNEKPTSTTPLPADKKTNDGKTSVDKDNKSNTDSTVPELMPESSNQSNTKKTGGKKKFSSFDSGSSPIEYTSVGGLNANREKGYIEMLKEVKIRQGDLEIYSDSARADIDPASEDITQILVDGNVRVKKIDPETGKLISAQAQQAIYYRLANKIEFKGAAKLNRGGDNLEGDIITYNLLTGDIHVSRPKGVLSEDLKK